MIPCKNHVSIMQNGQNCPETAFWRELCISRAVLPASAFPLVILNNAIYCVSAKKKRMEGELQQVLPALSRGQIKTLLHCLRKEGKVDVFGTRRGARWYMAEVLAEIVKKQP